MCGFVFDVLVGEFCDHYVGSMCALAGSWVVGAAILLIDLVASGCPMLLYK